MIDADYFASSTWRKLWKEIQKQTGLPADAEDKIADTVSSLDVLATDFRPSANLCLETSSASAEKELCAILMKLEDLHRLVSNASNTMYRAVSGSEMSNIRHKIYTMIDSLEAAKSKLRQNHRNHTALQRERGFIRVFVDRFNAILTLYGCPTLVQKKLQYVDGKGGCQELAGDNQWVYDVWALICPPSGKVNKYKWRIESVIRESVK